ncbi:MAG: hypothetical protein JXR65_04805 [Bacteroidales bacterium]|nr:hypothetical protein [Bacteroidales bacterium]
MMMIDRNKIRTWYENRIQYFSVQQESVQKKIRTTSIWRIAVFLLMVVGVYLAAALYDSWLMVLFVLVPGLSLFMVLIIHHVRLFREKQHYSSLLEINETERRLMGGNYEGKEEGNEFLDPEHPFASDLGVFGKRSLFQLIDRCVTYSGKVRLAETLLGPLKQKTRIAERQKAIEELSGLPEWRQDFQALGQSEMRDEVSLRKLLSWAGTKTTSFRNLWNDLMLVVNPLVGFTVVALIFSGMISETWFFIFLLLPGLNLAPKLAAINKEHILLGKQTALVEVYARLFQKVQDHDFSSALLQESRQALTGKEVSAQKAFRQLAAVSKAFDYRLNFLVGLFLDLFFLWDIRQVIRLERWKEQYGSHLHQWFQQLALVDELSSWAGFAYNFPDASFPEVSERESVWSGQNLRHPFIDERKCVGNPIELKGWGQFHVITGANMAGKSTYLRTVGVNLLLAMCGAPVTADRLRFTPVQLFTGIKTSDSLQDGASYFFAELKRLKEMIERLDKGERLFVVLDEILRGTNSKDKQQGSKALLKKLKGFTATGLIATHDLSLGKLSEEFPEHIQNKRFEVEIKGQEMVFDYTLKAGISQNLNASFLMKKMGITERD